MTTIAAIHVHSKGLYFGSDTQVTAGNRRVELMSPSGKWVVAEDGNWICGYAGAFRTANIIEAERDTLFHKLDSPVSFVYRLQDTLHQHHFSLKARATDDEEEGIGSRHPTFDCSLLLGSRDGLWEIGPDFSVLQCGDSAATGSGSHYALGALHALSAKKPVDRLKAALMTAISLDPYSGGKIVIGTL